MMGNTILDSLTLNTSLYFIGTVGKGNFTPAQNDCYTKLLTGIVLWDKLLFPSSSVHEEHFERLEGDSLTKKLCNEIIEPLDESLLKPSFVLIDAEIQSPDELRNFVIRTTSCTYTEEDIARLNRRIDMYLDVSSRLGMSFLPHPVRDSYLLSNEPRKAHDREEMLRWMEKCINEDYTQSSAVHLNTTLLYDYIKDKAGEAPREQLEFAIFLRNEPDVKALRKSLNKFEQKFKPGSVNYKEISQDEVSEIASEVFNKYKKNRNRRVEVDINGGVSAIGGTAGFAVKNIQLPRLYRRKIHKKFLVKLIKFGLDERV